MPLSSQDALSVLWDVLWVTVPFLLSASLHLVFMGRRNHWDCADGTVLPFSITLEYKPYLSVFSFFFLKLFHTLRLSVYQKQCDNASPKQQGTNKIPLCGHDWPVCCCICRRGFRAFECLRVLSLSERISRVNSNILTRALNKMKQGDANRRRGRKQAHLVYACPPPRPSILFPLCV